METWASEFFSANQDLIALEGVVSFVGRQHEAVTVVVEVHCGSSSDLAPVTDLDIIRKHEFSDTKEGEECC